MSQVNQLHRTRDDVLEVGGAEKRTELLEWVAFHNPSAKGEATYFVAEDAGAIVALQGRMPVEFAINGTRTRGYYAHDTYVHPDYRKKGLGFPLVASLAQAIEQRSDSFFCVLGGTPLNLKIQRRMGYREISPVPQYVKVLDPYRQLCRFLRSPLLAKVLNPFALILLSLVDALLKCVNRTHLRTIPIERFDDRFDELMKSMIGRLGICSYKGSAYLNWKYVDRPFKKDTIFAVERDGCLAGFVVLAPSIRPSGNVGAIMDMIADPEDKQTIATLCQTAVDHFRKQNAQYIWCAMSDGRFVELLRRFLFFRFGSGKAMLLGNIERFSLDNISLTDISKWHITLGESDTFMLTL